MDRHDEKRTRSSAPRPMRVGIAGTGRLAQAVGALLTKNGQPPAAIAGRDAESVSEAARFTGAANAARIDELGQFAEVVLVAVSDDAIEDVARQIAEGGAAPQICLHMCGSAGPELLASLHARGCATGVVHPLQTIPTREAGVDALVGCYYGYCGEGGALEEALRLIRLFEGTPIEVRPDRWALYHAAAITACNYSVTLAGMSLDLFELAGIERAAALQALGPILRNALKAMLGSSPEAALTGPIRRGDVRTIRRHLNALEEAPDEIRKLYRTVGLCTVELSRRAGLSPLAAEKLADVLRHEKL